MSLNNVPLPLNEERRLAVLQECNILDSLPEEDYDDLVFLAAQICGAPIALISLVDAERQWFKARLGLNGIQTPRNDAFCAHAILNPNEVMIVPDALEDERFAQNPLVTGEPKIRFYAGAPIVVTEQTNEIFDENGISSSYALGTICVISDKPAILTETQQLALQKLARQAGNLLDLRLRRILDGEINRQLRESERRLNDAQSLARIGSWEYQIATGKITWSPETFRLLDRDPKLGEPTYQEHLASHHPDDVRLLSDAVNRAVSQGIPYGFDLRILRPEGGVRWVHAQGNPVMDYEGTVTGLMGTVQDISPRKLAEQQQRDLARNLERSNRMLDDFASVASHDLKEPLRKIKTFGSMLRRALDNPSDDTNEHAGYYIERMTDAADRMQKMIDGLLQLSRFSQKAVEQRRGCASLREICCQVLVDLEIPIHESKADIKMLNLPQVWADPLQMRQLLQNLVGNALKYRRPTVAPRIEVVGIPSEDEEFLTFQVRDNGMGIESRDLLRIFEPFERLDTPGIEGTGIGLTICQRIVEAHNGTITVESVRGEGTTFTISLPCCDTSNIK